MNRWTWVISGLVFLALLAPLASIRPDPVQRLLRLPGAVDTSVRALGGMVIAAFAVWALAWTLAWFKKHKP